jgi:1-aminocyclopropane-1-carboxylate deaminase
MGNAAIYASKRWKMNRFPDKNETFNKDSAFIYVGSVLKPTLHEQIMNADRIQQMQLPSPLERLSHPVPEAFGLEIYIKRDDLIHPVISGNKWRKLKYNLISAELMQAERLITFGGAFSNHLAAVAGASEMLGLKSTGIIRGEIDTNNPTLRYCLSAGMELIPVSREEYREKEESREIRPIIDGYSNAMVIPEGGTNADALPGVAEIMDELRLQMHQEPDFIVLAAGTGGTASGLLSHKESTAEIICFSSLKSGHLKGEIEKLAGAENSGRLHMIYEFHFGGYAKWNETLLDFIDTFGHETGIPLEHVYTGKAMYGLMELIKCGHFRKGSRIVFLHTGGLQGRAGLQYMKEVSEKRRHA